jgi:hypothetical protein
MSKPLIHIGVSAILTGLTPKSGELAHVAMTAGEGMELEVGLELSSPFIGGFAEKHPSQWASLREKVYSPTEGMNKISKWLVSLKGNVLAVGVSKEFGWIYNYMIDLTKSCQFGSRCLDSNSWVAGRQGQESLSRKWRDGFVDSRTSPIEGFMPMSLARANLWVVKQGAPMVGQVKKKKEGYSEIDPGDVEFGYQTAPPRFAPVRAIENLAEVYRPNQLRPFAPAEFRIGRRG